MTAKGAYHIWVFPHTKLIAVFHPDTATGKLKAVMIPTTPRGFHCSSRAWLGPIKEHWLYLTTTRGLLPPFQRLSLTEKGGEKNSL